VEVISIAQKQERLIKQESRAAASKPRDAEAILSVYRSPTTFTTRYSVAKIRKPGIRQWRYDGVAAASSDGVALVGKPRGGLDDGLVN